MFPKFLENVSLDTVHSGHLLGYVKQRRTRNGAGAQFSTAINSRNKIYSFGENN